MSDTQFILPNMFISLYSDGVIEFNHSICGISPIISSTMYINKMSRKEKLEKINGIKNLT